MRRRALLVAASTAWIAAACGRDPPPQTTTAARSTPRPPDATLGDELRKFDRDVVEILRGKPVASLTDAERAARERGTTRAAPASAADVDALEKRIGKPLPPSYRAFLATTDGMMFEGWLNQVMLLPAADVKPFSVRENPGMGIWLAMPDIAVPLVPEAGGPLPGSALLRAWVISSVEDGDTYFILPDRESRDGEWPVWSFGTKNPGAYGYRSFRAMFEREREAALRNLAQRR